MEFITLEPFSIVGISLRTNMSDIAKLQEDMQGLWTRMVKDSIISKIPNKVSADIYSVYTEYEGDYTKPYTALLGCKVNSMDNLPDGLVGKSFPGGKYVKVTASGNIMNGIIGEAWRKIYSTNLDRSYVADFELYGQGAMNPINAQVDIFVSVKG